MREGLGDILRRHRERLGLSQEELAEAAGGNLSVKTIGNIERGHTRPYRHTLETLCAALGLEGDEREELLAARARATRAVPDGTVSPVLPAPSAPTPVLPTPATPLVGRAREAEEVSDLLERPGVRLVTLTGTGGAGKTRLALEVASRLAGVYGDGLRFIDLSPIRDPALVSSAIASTLGVREEPARTLVDTLVDYLRSREMLLVLDNLEQVLPATPLVGRLLFAAPRLKVLATSRVALRLYGEQEYAVPPLGLPQAADRDAIRSSEAVRLFLERAQAVRPGFALTDANGPTVLEICRRLDGLPLAIELAAARVRVFPPEALLARLGSRLGTLTGGARDLPERQRTLRATLDWSYELLDGRERLLFARLGVFSGGFDLAAADAVCDPDGELDVPAGVESLVGQSLVLAREGAGGEPRFAMLETIREYAAARLAESEEADAFRRRHAAYYLELAERAEPELKGAHQAEWFGRLEIEHGNLQAAMGYLLEQGAAEDVIQMGWALWLFWSIRGHLSEGQRWMERALAHAETLSLRARVQASWVRAMLLFLHGAVDQAAPLLEGCAEEAGRLGDQEVLMQTLGLRGFVAVSRGDLSSAAALLSEALMLARSRDDCWGIGNTLNGLAHVALAQGDFDRAMEHLQEGEALLREAGDWFSLIANLNIQALVAQLRGDVVQIRRLLHESVRISQRLGDKWAIAYGLIGLAIAAAMQGEAGRAARLYGATEVLLRGTDLAFAFPATRVLYEQHLAAIRTRLDADTFMMAWAEGRAMTLEQAITYALQNSDTGDKALAGDDSTTSAAHTSPASLR